jgi:nucleoside-diphosphate-sugar epimerase
MKILIIGGSRFVGPLIVRGLSERGHQLTVFNRGRQSLSYPEEVKFVQGDRDGGFPKMGSFDVVIDTCAYSRDQIENALESISFEYYLNFGTAASYKKTDKFPLKESDELGDWPLWGEYNRGKVACENALLDNRVPHATVRPPYVLGPGNYAEREVFIFRKLIRREPLIIPGDGVARIQCVFSDEVARAMILLAEKKAQGSFNVCGDDIVTLEELVLGMGRIAGISPVIHFNPETDGGKFNPLEFPFANESMICDNSKIRTLGMRFMPLFDGLKRDYKSFYKHLL